MNIANDKKTSYNVCELKELNFDFTHDEIIKNLQSENISEFEKIFSVLSMQSLNTIEEAIILIKNLINHPTPIREVVALKLEEIYNDKFFNEEIKEIFINAIIDINPNVCRAICSLISKSIFLKNKLTQNIILRINKLLKEINQNNNELGGFYDNEQKIRKNHAKNKKLFSLYWFLEALSICNYEKNNSEVLEILKQTIKFNDYTIREKTAKILVNLEEIPNELLQIAKNDQNFYVKNLVYDKINFED